jgi:hypothetical protein
MDAMVEAALRKWPNVPHCFGWLALDARGDWWMRDDRVQAAGPFPKVKGSRIEHDKLLAFISRNYAHDGDGAWFFQNGPQRVYVELEAAPWVWRLAAANAAALPLVTGHTGLGAVPRAVLVDEHGRVYLATDDGLGIVHTQDMGVAADAIEAGLWMTETVRADDLPTRYGFRRSPAAARPVPDGYIPP